MNEFLNEDWLKAKKARQARKNRGFYPIKPRNVAGKYEYKVDPTKIYHETEIKENFRPTPWWMRLFLWLLPTKTWVSVDYGEGEDSTVVMKYKRYRGKIYLIDEMEAEVR